MKRLISYGLVLALGCSQDESSQWSTGATELCLEGRYDIGARYQGLDPNPGEWVDATWCVVTEPDTERVLYSARGLVNHDYDNSWSVAYEPPEVVRIINRESPPDVEFQGTNNLDEARRVRRLDPRRLAEELDASGSIEGLAIELDADRVVQADSNVDMPLRGTVAVRWSWDWTNENEPSFELVVDGERLFEGRARWQALDDEELESRFARTSEDPIEVPGEQWPTRVNPRLVEQAPGVYLARGIRTGFQHLVVDTDEGLVVVDAPAGWIEFHHLPPSDLVPGLGVSGLSERLVDFLLEELPGRRLAHVVLTHHHDDHAGGARAFAAAGAKVWAPEEIEDFLETALNRAQMPDDRLTRSGPFVDVAPVRNLAGPSSTTLITSAQTPVFVYHLGSSPHARGILGVGAQVAGSDRSVFFVSDVHVPRTEDPTPRAGSEDTDCWFAEWATSSLPASVEIVNSHSPIVTPLARLEQVLETEACRSPAA